jgi:hypothetical protein
MSEAERPEAGVEFSFSYRTSFSKNIYKRYLHGSGTVFIIQYLRMAVNGISMKIACREQKRIHSEEQILWKYSV